MQLDQGQKKRGIWIAAAILVIIALICAGVTVYLLCNGNRGEVPAYAPQKIDENASELEDDGSRDKLEAGEGGGAVSLTYSAEATIDLTAGKVSFMIQNPERSTQDLIIQVLMWDDNGAENEIARSELIPVGYGINELTLENSEGLVSGTYEGTVRVSFYDPDGGEKAVVNTDIPVTITVIE